MRVELDYPITWLHDALLAAHPTVAWYVQGFDGQWAEVTADTLPAGFNLAAFAATVTEPVRTRKPTVEERLAALETEVTELKRDRGSQPTR